jgi:hypothetical protein
LRSELKEKDLKLKSEKVKLVELKTGEVRVTRNSGLSERLEQAVEIAANSEKKLQQQAKKHTLQLVAKDHRFARTKALKNMHRHGKIVVERKLARREKKAERDRDPNAKPGNISDMPLHMQKVVHNCQMDVVKMRETIALEAEHMGLMSLLRVRKRGEPAPVELCDLGFRLMARGLSAGIVVFA